MLDSLLIKNYAIIENIRIKFSDGLNIITGETGAGKSILLGALRLILGGRADTDRLVDIEKKCVVRAYFKNIPLWLKPIFDSADLYFEPDLTIQRELLPSGKSKAYINETPVNLKTLRSISSKIVDLHQQFDQLDILEDKRQIQYLDAFIGHREQVKSYRQNFDRFMTKQQELNTLRQRSVSELKEQDFLKFQLQELKALDIHPDTDERLEADLALLTHAEDLKNALTRFNYQLNETEDSTLDLIRDTVHTLHRIESLSPAFLDFSQRLDSLGEELRDLTLVSTELSDSLEVQSNQIEQMTERVNLLNQLMHKHRMADIKELAELQTTIEDRLQSFRSIEHQIRELEQELELLQEALQAEAENISVQRSKAAERFSKKVQKTLRDLEMPKAKFEVAIRRMESIGAQGIDHVQFLFSANPGSKLQLLKKVASGGELSRLNLSLKSLLASNMDLPTMIFDEIDSGISGKVALHTGLLLKELSENHQLICITHSPQIAARAKHHLYVYKETINKKTTTHIKTLDSQERIYNIAVMLSSDPPSKAALTNAKELINY